MKNGKGVGMDNVDVISRLVELQSVLKIYDVEQINKRLPENVGQMRKNLDRSNARLRAEADSLRSRFDRAGCRRIQELQDRLQEISRRMSSISKTRSSKRSILSFNGQ